MSLAPLVGLLLLLPAGVVVSATRAAGLPPLVQACCAVIALTLCTRALHLDGLADTADGLSASYDRGRALAVMRTGDVGPSGAAAIALVLILQIACGSALLARGSVGLILAAFAVVVSRTCLTWACIRGVPSARAEGLGATVASSVPRSSAGGITICLTALGAAAAAVAGGPWWAGPATVAGAALACAALLWRCRPRLGGISGDVLGAGVEIGLSAALLVAAACA